ncbi:unnamed protein product [Adineta steineri]|uniref:NHL repeat containing protein n=1 Tax=Adineta steineri TaxID=433720 RepID=A0A814IM98_9BILA|nr:unnamed protein product [Adineta steineri]CAF3765483.1 unnamed protein product [Adineta steineri]
MIGTNDDDTGVCGFLWSTCSRLAPCNSSDNSCVQSNTICVKHPYCHDLPICYPVPMISDIDCQGQAMNKNGFIYVSDYVKGEVRQWKEGNQYGRIVAGSNYKGNDLNQLNKPIFIFIDKNSSLYISDSLNHRVMKWEKDSKEGIIITDGNGQGNSLKQLSSPTGVIVDRLGQIYTSDSMNN